MSALSSSIAESVVRWFREHRRDLPWRRTRDPYAIWVSEVMLQQTRIAVVWDYYERWMQRFPTAAALAAAPLDDVLAAWSGLGYYGRARNLHRGAREVAQRFGGQVPATAEELRSLPGVGRYTAGAVASIGFGRREPLVDGNVARVLARLFAIEDDVRSPAGARRLWQIAGELVPAERPGDFNQGLMELGQKICTPAAPRCDACPLSAPCAARAGGRTGDLPVIGKRTADRDKPLLRADAVWLERGGRVLLARRRPRGLFGGLWELPQAGDRERLQALFAEIGARLELGRAPAPVFRHRQVLSHRRLSIDLYVGHLQGRLDRRAFSAEGAAYERVAWHSLGSLGSLGVAASSRAILRRHQELDGWTSEPPPSRSSRRATRRSSRA